MKQIIKKAVPQSVIARLRRVKNDRQLRREYAIDRQRYAVAMLPEDHAVSDTLSGRNLEAQLTKDYHRVEKGLALPDPKKPFGRFLLERFDLLLPVAKRDDPEAAYVRHAESARAALLEWNAGGAVVDEVSPLRTPQERGLFDPERFFFSRHSVRDFERGKVPQDVLDQAVRLAISTPSVCNRQAWQVQFFHGADVAPILRHQNGNSGFAESVPALAVVTIDSRLFAGAGERNQGWIEGGLFSMTLVWALHALGMDSCMLNMSVTNKHIDPLRTQIGLGDHELVIMMIAIGHGREGHRRARSPRRGIGEVIR